MKNTNHFKFELDFQKNQFTEKKLEAGKNIRFKIILKLFFTGYILPGCGVLWTKNKKNNYLTDIKARGGGLYIL